MFLVIWKGFLDLLLWSVTVLGFGACSVKRGVVRFQGLGS